ncbi:MAG: MMPL family transporter [Phaeovulum sp.]|uniref:efflux RND transporter permease subunit n=1 Tax=Phaeovulum sp. TaxID=2934796 RepID=UPI002735E8F2|nr:MMPL family transporter [Phaeovulum sp.]MDP3860507.1 MMPL family transporter [Phaeovulum sp.]
MRLPDLARLLRAWQAHRRIAILALALVTLAAAFGAIRVRAEIDMAALLHGNSPNYMAWSEVERRFAPFSRDEVYVVAADKGTLAEGDRLAALEDLLIELNLSPGVAATLSIFSMPDATDPGRAWLKSATARGLDVAERLATLRAENPTAAEMISVDLAATLVLVMPASGYSNAKVAAAIAPMVALPPQGLTLRPAGLGEMQRTIAFGLIRDQIWLTPASVTICLLITFWLFGSWRAAVICGLPPLVGLSWFFGWIGWAGIAMDQFMAVVPTVLIVLSFSDCIHLYHASVAAETGRDDAEAVVQAQAQTLPAAFMTSLTTAVAFLSLLVVQAPALSNLSMAGAVGMALTFVAVALAFPLLFAALGTRHGELRRTLPRFALALGAAKAAAGHPRRVVLATLVLAAALLAMESRITTSFSLTEYLPRKTDVGLTLDDLGRLGLASDSLQVIIDDTDGVAGISAADKALLATVAAELYGPGAGNADALAAWAESGAGTPLLRRFVAEDRLSYALPLAMAVESDGGAQLKATHARLSARFAELGLADKVAVRGFSLVMIEELPGLIGKLRLGFYLSILAITGLIWLLLGSARLALVSVLPNVIPILCVDAWLYLSGQQVSLTSAIATTVAFGIAVDNSIHLLNRFRLAPPGPLAARVTLALAHAAPPIITTTVLLLGGFSVVLLSSMPSVATFGILVGLALVLAMVSSVFLLPGLVRWSLK